VPRRRASAARPRARNLESEPEKRRAILHAAVRAFAEKGYQGCRIADVAHEAGVAYGLVYHYFRDKDELLESVFDEQWTIFIQAIRAISSGPGTAADHLAGVIRFALDVYRTAPAAVKVLILEVARSPHSLRAGSTRRMFETALKLLAEQVRRGQEAGDLRRDLEPAVAAASVLGALEMCLTAMVVGALGRPEASDEEMERVKQQVVEVALGGLLPRR
jgi:TetR/AcrR family fatty acid metabolism transcriptional regulator